jgi:hypothetical protein
MGKHHQASAESNLPLTHNREEVKKVERELRRKAEVFKQCWMRPEVGLI